MARVIRFNGEAWPVDGPITLTQFQTLVGGFIRFIDLESGDVLVVNEHIHQNASQFTHFNNPAATVIAGQVISGDVVLCTASEIA